MSEQTSWAKIDKTYRPEALGENECHVDAEAERLIVITRTAMVVLPAAVERSGAVNVAGLRTVRSRHQDPEATLRIVKAPTPDWRTSLPTFRRGDSGTFSLTLNAHELKRIADSLGVVSVTVTAAGQQPPLVVQPVDPEAEELAVMLAPPQRERKAACQRQTKPAASRGRRGLEALADEMLTEAGDDHLLSRRIG